MNIQNQILAVVSKALRELYDHHVEVEKLSLQPTRKEFEGTYTLVTFPFLRFSKLSPEQTGEQIGKYLGENSELVSGFNVIKGFLNLDIADGSWISLLNEISETKNYGLVKRNGRSMMVEYASPNTNKPLHLGHLRNVFLGYSVSKIYQALGYDVTKVQIINDRGIHICKSMLAWQKFGSGETPESSGLKGDKIAGKYYVRFDQEYKKQIEGLVKEGKSEEDAKKEAPILLEAQEMLRKWEARDSEIYDLW